MEEKQLSLVAKYRSVRQTAISALSIMFVTMTIGTAIVKKRANVSTAQAILFSVYTVTSAGFGNVKIPLTDRFLGFVIVYIFFGISVLAILAAQSFQYLTVEAARIQHARDKANFAQQGFAKLWEMTRKDETKGIDYRIRVRLMEALKMVKQPYTQSSIFHMQTTLSNWRRNPIGKALLIPCYLLALLLTGTFVMMALEGWSFVEALYFSTFAMTTVGYGDLAPTKQSSTWFVIFWLPFNVSFLAAYLGTVAHYYVQLHEWNARRIELRLKEEHRKKMLDQNQEPNNSPNISMDDHSGGLSTASVQMIQDIVHQANVGNNVSPPVIAETSTDSTERNGGDLMERKEVNIGGEKNDNQKHIVQTVSVHPNEQAPTRINGQPRRQRLRELSQRKLFEENSGKLNTLDTLPENTQIAKEPESANDRNLDGNDHNITTHELLVTLGLTEDASSSSIRATSRFQTSNLSEFSSIKLNFKVLERLARIIAAEIIGVRSTIEIKGNVLSVTFEALKDAADRWLIPFRARETFRSVCFESLIVVGEHELLRHGADAFFDLNPFQFNSLFGPFVVALEDADTKTAWLTSTDILARGLRTEPAPQHFSDREEVPRTKHSLKNMIEEFFPVNPGNAVLAQI